jgi:cell pole-organizing protein PopZ
VHDEPAPFAQAPTVTAPAPKPADDIVFETVQEAPVSSAGQSNESIFSDRSRKAIDDAFAKLDAPEDEAPRPRASATPTFAPVDGNSVEAVFERAVRDAVGPHLDQWLNSRKDDLVTAMRPLIREWMDDHFPALLEGAVRDEVARVAKSRGR